MDAGPKNLSNALILLLNLSSIVLIIGSLFLVQILSLLFGFGQGIAVQAYYDHGNLSATGQQIVSQATYLHDNILESYVLAVIAIMLFGIAFLVFLRRQEKSAGGAKRYLAMHTAFVFVYALVYFIISIDSAQYLNEPYIYAIYVAIALSLIIDVFFDYVLRLQKEHTTKMKRSLSVNPNTPFSNMVEIQDKIFSKMGGDLKVVDKHFNSTALSNFHRLIIDNLESFKSITVISSAEMMDSNFGRSISDFSKELQSRSVGFEIRLMDDADRVEQHERMILDDNIAYKIPPFNIINKRSEHIIMINRNDAEKRFKYLYGRSINFENYSLKKGREQNGQTEPTH